MISVALFAGAVVGSWLALRKGIRRDPFGGAPSVNWGVVGPVLVLAVGCGLGLLHRGGVV